MNLKKGFIFLGLLILTGFGTSFLIRFLRDGDVYPVELVTSFVGVVMIGFSYFLQEGDRDGS